MTWSQRVVDRVAVAVAGRGVTRRGFLKRAAVVGSALAVDPTGYLLKPRTAYATVCGDEPECSQGWTAFCCTINDGANLCPPGSFAAGWWKVDDSAFCDGQARYYIDCNRLPGASCECGCGDGPCDHRRVCCNVFRYGQCNQHVAGVTEVVCRVILCTPPWVWDASCTTTARTDPATATHNATCLPGPGASDIAIRYQDLGMTGSILGRPLRDEEAAGGGGRVATYENGFLLWRPDLAAFTVLGVIAVEYRSLGREDSALGYPVADHEPIDGGEVATFEHGAIWSSDVGGTHATTGPLHDAYVEAGGAEGTLGFPADDIREQEDGTLRLDLVTGWSIVYDPATDETTFLRDGEPSPGPGGSGQVVRWTGADRIATAVAVSQRIHDPGVEVVHVSRADDFADALGGGVAAAVLGGPMLLTATDELSPATADEVARLLPSGIVVLGGPAAVADGVIAALGEVSSTDVTRVAGDDRFATAAAISRRTHDPDTTTQVYVASGLDSPDALAAVPAAARDGAPLLLVSATTLPTETRGEIRRLAPDRIVVLGGKVAVDNEVVNALGRLAREVVRISGIDRFATAAAISRTWDTAADVVVVNGLDFPDALAAGPAAARLGAPILLVAPTIIPGPTVEELRRLRPQRIIVIGGTAAVSKDVSRALERFTTAAG